MTLSWLLLRARAVGPTLAYTAVSSPSNVIFESVGEIIPPCGVVCQAVAQNRRRSRAATVRYSPNLRVFVSCIGHITHSPIRPYKYTKSAAASGEPRTWMSQADNSGAMPPVKAKVML